MRATFHNGNPTSLSLPGTGTLGSGWWPGAPYLPSFARCGIPLALASLPDPFLPTRQPCQFASVQSDRINLIRSGRCAGKHNAFAVVGPTRLSSHLRIGGQALRVSRTHIENVEV